MRPSSCDVEDGAVEESACQPECREHYFGHTLLRHCRAVKWGGTISVHDCWVGGVMQTFLVLILLLSFVQATFRYFLSIISTGPFPVMRNNPVLSKHTDL